MAGSGLQTRAAQYLRMSTEHQRYSILNQREAISAYAVEHGIEIVRSYVDEGRSGLTLRGRHGLQQLIADALAGDVDFTALLIYDVSRWGRFQDVDAAAYYEYICRNAGLSVVYCMERFDNDGSPLSAIIKSIKRIMAAEYSRELSVKSFAGQARLASQGFKAGGLAGVGLRRQLEDQDSKPKLVLQRGELKSLASDRVRLVRGPRAEIELVRSIYRRASKGDTIKSIIDYLESIGAKSDSGRPWSHAMVMNILTNEKYIGELIYNKRSKKLATKLVLNDPSLWIRAYAAYKPIVDRESFNALQIKINSRKRRRDHDFILCQLESLYTQFGYLSCRLINEQPDLPHASYFYTRYGSMANAYARVGFTSALDTTYIEHRRARWPMRKAILAEIVEGFARGGVKPSISRSGVVSLPAGGQIIIKTALPLKARSSKRPKWKLSFRNSQMKKGIIIILVRMDIVHVNPLDFCFAIPMHFFCQKEVLLSAWPRPHPGLLRSDTLEPLFANAAAWIRGAPVAAS